MPSRKDKTLSETTTSTSKRAGAAKTEPTPETPEEKGASIGAKIGHTFAAVRDDTTVRKVVNTAGKVGFGVMLAMDPVTATGAGLVYVGSRLIRSGDTAKKVAEAENENVEI